jgi:hypothetical protein
MLIAALSACTYTVDAPQPTLLRSGGTENQIDAIVALVVTPDLKAARWSQKLGMVDDPLEVPMGDALIGGSKQMLSGMFRAVEIVPAPAGVPAARYYVIPTMVRMEKTPAPLGVNDQKFTLAVEWRVIDADGRTVFVDTIISEGRGPVGNVFTKTGDLRDVLRLLLNDTFAKAQAKLMPVLRHS